MCYLTRNKPKAILIVVNAVLMAVGPAFAIAVLIILIAWYDFIIHFMNHVEWSLLAGFFDALTGLMAFCIVTFFIAALGCFSTVFGCNSCIMVYSLSLTVVLTIQIGIIVGARNADFSKKRVRDELLRLTLNYKEGGDDPLSRASDYIFQYFKCCGIYNYEIDFIHILFQNTTLRDDSLHNPDSFIPVTCCRSYKLDDHRKAYDSSHDCLNEPSGKNAYTTGCVYIVTTVLNLGKNIAVIFILVITLLEILLLGCAFVMYHLTAN